MSEKLPDRIRVTRIVITTSNHYNHETMNRFRKQVRREALEECVKLRDYLRERKYQGNMIYDDGYMDGLIDYHKEIRKLMEDSHE